MLLATVAVNVQSCAIEVAVPPVAVRVTVGVGTGLSAWMTTVPVFVPAAAVTVALASVVSRVLASPLPSVDFARVTRASRPWC